MSEGDRRAVLALGSNLGNRLEHLQAAVDLLAATPGVVVEAVSPVYETDPVGGPQQPDYLNAVVVVRTSLSASELLDRALEIEIERGRVRVEHWGPRTLDVDLVTVGHESHDDERLRLPHPRAHERAFVLVPWEQAEPGAGLPGHGAVADLVAGLAGAGREVRRRDDISLAVPS